ncbi:DUF732 domain-containing protein [Nocardia pseudovaccinii]|uniref:DUF732 domain-containing protein n=1 Tax=Nocardia pseudovaccinii TaxID=189540 RepID=UPI003D91BBB3
MHDLIAVGVLDHPNAAVQDAAVELGYAICDERRSGKSATDIVIEMRDNGDTMQTAANWVVAAENDLCPRFAER